MLDSPFVFLHQVELLAVLETDLSLDETCSAVAEVFHEAKHGKGLVATLEEKLVAEKRIETEPTGEFKLFLLTDEAQLLFFLELTCSQFGFFLKAAVALCGFFSFGEKVVDVC